MEVPESFLSKDHERLLSFAVWAKYLGWIVLLLWAAASILNFFAQVNLLNVQFIQSGQGRSSFSQLLRQDTTLAFQVLIGCVRIFFQGLVYFLILKGISLGLFMIAETDVNYRNGTEDSE